MKRLIRSLGWLGIGLWLVACSPHPADPARIASPQAPSGQLVVIAQGSPPDHKILTLDVETEATETLFAAPEFSQIYQLDVSADGKQLVFAYTPPPTIDTGFFDRSMLYRLPLDTPEREPELVLGGTRPQEFYLQPAFSPDGQFLYYTKLAQDLEAVVTVYRVTLERYDLGSGEILPIAADGIWPRLSPDGSRLTYIGVDPTTQARGLFIAAPDGSQTQSLVPMGIFFDIDSPLFSADGAWVYFSVAKDPPGISWWEQLLGVKAALAHTEHSVPSDWWRVPVTGGEPEQITGRAEIIIYGDLSPTGQHLAYSTTNTLYLLNTIDSSLRQISIRSLSVGVLAWLP